MNVDSQLPDRQNFLTLAGDTERACDVVTDTEIDTMVRSAVAHVVEGSHRHDAAPLIARLANLRTIQNLASIDEPLPDFRNYEVLEELGRGGMGIVYKVRHRQLGKIQAIKVVHRDNFHLSEDSLQRFKREARAVGSLCHPNIVAAHDANFENDPPYFVMDYVDGESLAAVQKRVQAAGKAFPIAAACDVVRQAAEGLQSAHERKIVHRDIKPGNLMLDSRGVVRVLDLGLARAIATEPPNACSGGLTTEHQVIGTPDYMAPEQLRSSPQVDGRADVYALGVTLFHLLAGRPPFASDPRQTFIIKATSVLTDPLPDIRQMRPDVPDRLAKLITGALERDVDRRIQSAGDLAACLAPWASSQTLQELAKCNSVASEDACAPPPTSAIRQFPPRNRWLSMALASCGAFLVLFAVVFQLALPDGGYLTIECEEPEAQITVSAVQGGRSTALALSQSPDQTFKLETGRWEIRIVGSHADRFQLSTSQVILHRGDQKVISITRVGPAPRDVDADLQPEAATPTDPGLVHPAATSSRPSDTELLQRLSEFDWTRGDEGALPGYASHPSELPGIGDDWQIITKFAHASPFFSVSPLGTYLAVFDDPAKDPYVRIIERASGRLRGIVQRTGYYGRQIAWSVDESRLLIFFRTGPSVTAVVSNLDGAVLSQWEIAAEENEEPRAEWSPDGKSILFVTSKSIQQLSPDGVRIADFIAPGHGGANSHELTNQFWSPDSRWFAVSIDGDIRVYSRDGSRLFATLRDPGGLPLVAHRWHPSGDRILTNAEPDFSQQERQAIRLWTLAGEAVRYGFTELHESFAAFSPDGQFFVTNVGHVRDTSGQVLARLPVIESASLEIRTAMVCWPESDRMIWWSRNRGAGYSFECTPVGSKIREVERPLPVLQDAVSWMGETDRFTSLVSPLDSQTSLETYSFQWSLDGKADAAVLIRRDRGPVAFSPDGQRYACRLPQETIGVFTRDGQQEYELAPTSSGHLLSWSPNSRLLATAAGTNDEASPIEIWDRGEKIASLVGASSEIRILSWSANGSYLTAADGDLQVHLWDAETWSEAPLTKAGAGFEFFPGNNHWSHDSSGPRWSPVGATLAIPTLEGVDIVSADGTAEITIPVPADDQGAIWWRGDGEALLIGGTAYGVDGTRLCELSNFGNELFYHWPEGQTAIGVRAGAVMFWDDFKLSPQRLPLSSYSHFSAPELSMFYRGANAEWLSSDGRYLVLRAGANGSHPTSHVGGDVYLVDVRENRQVWAGLGFTDGKQLRIEPTGRSAVSAEEFDHYFAYVVRSGSDGLFPLTQLQFASRIGLSPAQQFAQRVLDHGGTLIANEWQRPIRSLDIRDARDLPASDTVVGVNLSGSQSLRDDDLAQLGALTPLQELNLSRTSVTDVGLAGMASLTMLKQLDLSGTAVTDAVAANLPPGLVELDLSRTDVGDLLLVGLKSSKTLERLDVSATQVSAKEVAALRSRLPHCTIIHENEVGSARNDVSHLLDHPIYRGRKIVAARGVVANAGPLVGFELPKERP